MKTSGNPTAEILNIIGASERVRLLHDGIPKFPEYTFDTPPDPIFGFPPVFAPVLSVATWPGYYGIVYDWFEGGSKGYFRYFVESSEFQFVSQSEHGFLCTLLFELASLPIERQQIETISAALGIHGEVTARILRSRTLADFQAILADGFKPSRDDSLPYGDIGAASRVDAVVDDLNGGDSVRVWRTLNAPGWQDLDEIAVLSQLSTSCQINGFEKFASVRAALRSLWGY